MKVQNVNKLLMQLINIQSNSGNEVEIGNFLADYLLNAGFEVDRMLVKDERFNVFAKIGNPKIVLQAHMDVVPTYIPASEDKEHIKGRGSCDTKGSIASMVVAALKAKEKGATDFGLLFTVGEEVDFAGAIFAQPFVEGLSVFLIVGEPTKLRPVVAHYGILVFSIICEGKAAHSSEPNLGENAIDKLVSLLNGPVKKLSVYKNTLMSLVKISGGIADNIIPDRAEALFSFRISPGDTNDYVKQMQVLVGDIAFVNEVQSIPPISSTVPKSLSFLGKGELVKYCTELTFFKNGLVFGPGDISNAHTLNERVRKQDLKTAVDLYARALEQYSL